MKTDKDDYWPGETVTITGSGWQPGETVTLKISEDADTHNDFTYTAVANAQGNIINAQFAPIENEVFHHFGMRFYLTATGVASTALNTFTDGNSDISGTVRNSVTNAAIAGATVACTTGSLPGLPWLQGRGWVRAELNADCLRSFEDDLEDADALVDLDAVLARVVRASWRSNSLRTTCQVCEDSCGLLSQK